MGLTDDIKNKAEDTKGQVKETVGEHTNDDQLRSEGQTDQGKADVKDKVSNAADKVKGGVENAKDKLTGH